MLEFPIRYFPTCSQQVVQVTLWPSTTSWRPSYASFSRAPPRSGAAGRSSA